MHLLTWVSDFLPGSVVNENIHMEIKCFLGILWKGNTQYRSYSMVYFLYRFVTLIFISIIVANADTELAICQ